MYLTWIMEGMAGFTTRSAGQENVINSTYNVDCSGWRTYQLFALGCCCGNLNLKMCDATALACGLAVNLQCSTTIPGALRYMCSV